MQSLNDTICSAGDVSHDLLIQQKLENQPLDLSDDEELREQMDMHSIIVSSISDEPLFTAEQVGRVAVAPVFYHAGLPSDPDCNNGGGGHLRPFRGSGDRGDRRDDARVSRPRRRREPLAVRPLRALPGPPRYEEVRLQQQLRGP